MRKITKVEQPSDHQNRARRGGTHAKRVNDRDHGDKTDLAATVGHPAQGRYPFSFLEANVCVYVYGTVSAIKTTVLLSEDFDEILKRRYGPRRISEAIKSRSALIPLTQELAAEAGKTDVAMRKRVHAWELADSIVLSTARNRNGKVATGDPHFRGLDESYMIS